MNKGILFFITLSILFSCNQEDDNNPTNQDDLNKVLLLKVDYLTNTFESGTELIFDSITSNFTIESEYTPPGDFGNIKLTYKELNKTLFDGSIIWLGSGKRNFPETLLDSNTFEEVKTKDFVTPKSGFLNIFNPDNETYDYNPIWSSVQKLVTVRNYLKSNPNATVKLFLYTPSVGIGDPKEWDWYIFIKN